tara:strand:- start:2350 stop:2835 length:486 start_codon:yes stop_codon:yes gene_type:complete
VSQSIKQKLKPALLAALDEEIQAALDGARQAHETASHADNKPENQYDTLALEAAYLAHGQSERIRELQDVRIRINQWPVADFGADDLITSGALVLLEPLERNAESERWLWITPVGGRQFAIGGKTIQVISTEAPLAQQLSQLAEGDEVTVGQKRWEISGCW